MLHIIDIPFYSKIMASDFKGNKAETIEFTSLSGILKATQKSIPEKPNQIQSTNITLDFPLNSPSSFVASDDIIKFVVGDLKIQDVQHSSATKKLLLRLDDHYTRSLNIIF